MKSTVRASGALLLSLATVTAGAGEGPALEETVVTGKRLERSVQDTMDSIAVFTETTLVERGLLDLGDVINQAAGVTTDNGRSFRIRGIDSGPIGTLRSELASLYVDGVALSGWVKAEGPQQMWDVQQVEIFRGPQSTNLGRNSLAGAIVVTTNRPTYDMGGAVRGGYADYGTWEAAGVLNVPLVEGVSALRLTYDQRESDGYVDNITRGEDDYAYRKSQTVRARWLLEPTEDLSVLASLQYVDNDYGDNSQAFEGSGYRREDRKALADVRGEYPIDAYLGSLTVDYRFNDHWRLKSITAGLDGDRSRTDDFDNSAANEGFVYREGEDENYSQELRLDFEGDNLGGSSGIYLSEIRADNINDSTVILNLGDFGVNDLIDKGAYPAQYPLLTGGESSVESTNYAVFSEWEWQFAPRWRLNFGGRYDWEEQEIEFQNRGSSPVVLPDPADYPGDELRIATYNGLLASLSNVGPKETGDTDFNEFLPHLGITYNWTDDVSTSFFVSKGYRAGGTEVTGLNQVNEYDPEYLWNYELALRSLLFGGRGLLNANVYYSDWEDQQVDVPEVAGNDEAFFIIENAGQSRLYGVEAEFTFAVTDGLTVFANLGYSHTEYEEFFSTADGDLSGNQFRFAPEWTGALGGNYLFGNGMFLNANMTYQDESWADNANTIELEDRVLANVRAGYENDTWRLEVWCDNLFDEEYATNIFGLQDENGNYEWGRMGAPRVYGGRVTYSF